MDWFTIIFFCIYFIVGIILGLLARDEDDHFSLFTFGLFSAIFFVLCWPFILLWCIHKALKHGFVIKHKGKVVWRYKR